VSVDFDRVAVSDVSRHYGRRRAVSRVTFEVSRGEILALLGPNGAGKSTLIGILATLVAPTSGTIRYGGHDAAAAGPEIRRRIGLLAHELHLYAELSARQNLEFFARLYGLRPADVVGPALERAGLSERADDQVGAFSRGMRQRLALERALLHRPCLILLDEPFTGLDDQAVGRVSDRLRALASNTILLVATHDIDLVQGLATRMAVIRDGRLVGDEPAGPDLRSRYRSLLSQHSSRVESRSAAEPAREGAGPSETADRESLRGRLRSRPSDSEAAPARRGEVATTGEAAPARGGGAPRE
jgi:heme exporter protein A